MQKKVLIISASPRRGGNSDLLCDEFATGTLEQGNLVEKIFLKDKKIAYCNGCGLCNNQKGFCSIKDDMEEILQKMIEADVMVLASPVYFYTINAQMKTFIDRTCARYTEINNKDFYFIVSAADEDITSMQRTIECFRGFADCLDNANEKGVIYGVGAWDIDEIKDKESMIQAYQMGKTI